MNFGMRFKVQMASLSTDTISIASWRSGKALVLCSVEGVGRKGRRKKLEKASFQDLSATFAQLDFISEVFLFKRLWLLI